MAATCQKSDELAIKVLKKRANRLTETEEQKYFHVFKVLRIQIFEINTILGFVNNITANGHMGLPLVSPTVSSLPLVVA